jgi:hypothetical protein
VDLRLPVTYRTFNFTDAVFGPSHTPIRGCDLTRVVYGDVAGEGYREKRALDDGYDAGNVWLGFRPIELSGALYGDTIEDLWDRMQALRRALTPTLAYADAPGDHGFLPLAFSQHTADTTKWPTKVMSLMMLARPQAQPHFIVEQKRLAGPSEYGFTIEWTAQMWCRDPRIYAQTPVGKVGSQEVALVGAGASGTFVNRGDYPAPVNFILYLASGGPAKTFRFVGIGTAFNLTLPTSVNPRIVRVDSVKKVVTYQEEVASGVPTEVLRMDLIDFDSGLTWPKVPTAGSLGYTWSATGGSGGNPIAGSKMFYSEAWA